MDIRDILAGFEDSEGIAGFTVLSFSGEGLASLNAQEFFPLASTAKVVIGATVAQEVEAGRLQWDQEITGLNLSPDEDSRFLYPHLQNRDRYTLRDVVEVMIACHDQNCASKIAEEFGGWNELQRLIRKSDFNVQINEDPANELLNIGTLHAVVKRVVQILDGFRKNPVAWQPVVSGLVRQSDKTAGIPAHCQWNMTGGLPNAMIDVGILGDFATQEFVFYGIAGKGLLDRRTSTRADEAAGFVLRRLYNQITVNKSG